MANTALLIRVVSGSSSVGALSVGALVVGLGCCTDHPQPSIAAASPSSDLKTSRAREQLPPAPNLGVNDLGIWSDLDSQITIQAPTLTGRGLLLWHAEKALLIVYDGIDKDGIDKDGIGKHGIGKHGIGKHAQAIKIYPVIDDGASDGMQSLRFKLDSGFANLWFRPGDAAELKVIISDRNRIDDRNIDSQVSFRKLATGEPVPGGDADGDGIPNSLDILIGATKTTLNRASYGAGYIRIEYPNGDVPRDVGVCTDVVIRAARNAGIDLQSALYKDIASAKRFYPMVRKRNRHIDHRRVKTLLPYFIRHWDLRNRAIDDPGDPLRPGDVIFFDTFPNRKGPDHMGIVSATMGAHGHPLIINNWTDGAVTQEMDLLSFVPVTHRFRVK